MATAGEPNDEDDKLKDIDREISELGSAMKEIFEIMKPFSDKLEKITQRKRECIDIRNRLTSEQHDRERHQQTVQRVIELEAKLKQAKCENVKLSDTNRKLKQSLDQAVKFSKPQKRKIAELENVPNVPDQSRSETEDSVAAVKLQTVQRMIELEAELKQAKCENVKLSDTNRKLKQSLDQAAKFSKAQKRKITELENVATVSGQSRSETEDSVAVVKTDELSRTKDELNEMRQRLSDVQERLTVAQQVTAATQQRALQESDNSEQLEMTPEHQPTTPTGSLDKF